MTLVRFVFGVQMLSLFSMGGSKEGQTKRNFVVTSPTAGRRFVVRDNICVITVDKIICQRVRNIGNGKLNELMTALLNNICK
jgi:hypothetical protein